MDSRTTFEYLFMRDLTTVKHVLLQVILAMKDAISLPWPAVRGGWATSMHDLEEGYLGLQDTTQWSFNHLSASQISMASSQNPQTTQPRKCANFIMKAHDPTMPVMEIASMLVHIVRNRVKVGIIQRASVLQN